MIRYGAVDANVASAKCGFGMANTLSYKLSG